MSDATFAESPSADEPLDFARLQAAAFRYEQQYAPQFWELRQHAGADWQAIVVLLQAGFGSESELSALQNLLQDWPDAEALQMALLATPLPLLESCCQLLRAQLQPADPESTEAPDLTANPDTPDETAPTLARLLLNLLEAHCFGSVVARAPAELQRALQVLQDISLAPLQVLTSHLPADLPSVLPTHGSALAPWLDQLPSEQLKQLRDTCYTQLQTLPGPARQPFAELLVCLNGTLVLRQLG
ncbi:MAG: hypothetical protein CVV27_06625 [Candidatus Melainabacteria bacterium HGW-Melainabacteria-1]|nr:MAG: hypothetical protein CVV27_06625 [Candidatus Melainabacteria bacterium HGW-Melainabacteria-1]